MKVGIVNFTPSTIIETFAAGTIRAEAQAVTMVEADLGAIAGLRFFRKLLVVPEETAKKLDKAISAKGAVFEDVVSKNSQLVKARQIMEDPDVGTPVSWETLS